MNVKLNAVNARVIALLAVYPIVGHATHLPAARAMPEDTVTTSNLPADFGREGGAAPAPQTNVSTEPVLTGGAPEHAGRSSAPDKADGPPLEAAGSTDQPGRS